MLAVADSGFPRGGANSRGCARSLFCKIVVENCVKMKVPGRGCAFLVPHPLDPPLVSVLLPPANEVWGKVICLQVCVCVHRGGCLAPGGSVSGGSGVCSRGGGCLLPPPWRATAASYWNAFLVLISVTWSNSTWYLKRGLMNLFCDKKAFQ